MSQCLPFDPSQAAQSSQDLMPPHPSKFNPFRQLKVPEKMVGRQPVSVLADSSSDTLNKSLMLAAALQ